uniref:Uncharacterized protein n=1 Tax=Arundo donax TaxID=35708 RepID=A0A0A8YYH2_ARUDO
MHLQVQRGTYSEGSEMYMFRKFRDSQNVIESTVHCI